MIAISRRLTFAIACGAALASSRVLALETTPPATNLAGSTVAPAPAASRPGPTMAPAATPKQTAAPAGADPALAPAPSAPGSPTPAPAAAAVTPPNTDFALDGATRSLGGAGAPASSTPYMIGDFFSASGQIYQLRESPNNPFGQPVLVGTIPNAGGTQRVKISENNSPIPRDRVFFAFNQFNNAGLMVQQGNAVGIDVSRYTPGFEKTFLDGLGSIELRTPVAYTQNPDVFLDNGPIKATQFGNMALALKLLLWRDDNFALAAGTGVNVPTGPDTVIFNNGQELLTLFNQSVHILPYVGAYWAPSARGYVQAFVQVDVAANGNGVNVPGTGPIGKLNDQTFLYTDVSMGYWLYRLDDAPLITGIIPILEFHYNTTLQNADLVANSNLPFVLGNLYNRLDILNVTAGTHFRLGPLSFLTIAAAFPLKTRVTDQQFDSEIIAQFNRLF